MLAAHTHSQRAVLIVAGAAQLARIDRLRLFAVSAHLLFFLWRRSYIIIRIFKLDRSGLLGHKVKFDLGIFGFIEVPWILKLEHNFTLRAVIILMKIIS